MRYKTIFDLIATEFGRAKIPFVLVGGFAVNHYKVSRATADVDLMMTEENYERALSLFKQNGYKETVRTSLFARLEGNEPLLMDLDVLFVDPKTFEGIVSESVAIEINGKKLKVPSLNHLIALKLHSLKNNFAHRQIPDLVDIINLVRINQIDVRKDSFRELCLKYGTQELYEKVLKSV